MFMNSSLNFLVLYSKDVNKMLLFYKTLGLSFVQEQHGKGPIHHACDLGNIVLEIYPGEQQKTEACQCVKDLMLGFNIDSIEEIVKQLEQAGGVVKSPVKNFSYEKRAIVLDPDGHQVYLTNKRIKYD